MHRRDGPRDRIGLEDPGAAGPQARLNPLFLEHLEPHAGTETCHQQADRVRAQLYEGDQITGIIFFLDVEAIYPLFDLPLRLDA